MSSRREFSPPRILGEKRPGEKTGLTPVPKEARADEGDPSPPLGPEAPLFPSMSASSSSSSSSAMSVDDSSSKAAPPRAAGGAASSSAEEKVKKENEKELEEAKAEVAALREDLDVIERDLEVRTFCRGVREIFQYIWVEQCRDVARVSCCERARKAIIQLE